jgi:hypothetical protein
MDETQVTYTKEELKLFLSYIPRDTLGNNLYYKLRRDFFNKNKVR